MSYFTDVYLKRINRDGKTRQERIKTREEKEFDNLVLKRTKYLANIYQVNDEDCDIQISLQPDTRNESKIVYNVMMSNGEQKLSSGDVLYIKQTVGEDTKETIWIILFSQDDVTKGYQLYKCICLDDIVNITDEYGNTMYSIPVKFISATNNLIQNSFTFGETQFGYKYPAVDRGFIARDEDFLINDTYFNYKDKGWKIEGKDNLSINNVAYVTIAQAIHQEAEPLSSEDILVGRDKNFFLNGR